MLYKPALCLAAVLCLAVMVTHGQAIDTVTGKPVHFSSGLFRRIQAQAASLNQQVTSQTQQYLAKMARNEQRMQQKLSSVDSNAAKALFANSQQQYAALSAKIGSDTGGRKVALKGQYQPSVDTLQGALAFLKQHPQLLAGTNMSTATAPASLTSATSGITSAGNSITGKVNTVASAAETKLQGAASQFQAVQAKIQDADIAKAYVAQRQQMISRYISQHSNVQGLLGKHYAAMNQATYYYSQRVQQYKAMLNDPGAMAQKALAMLAQMPAFQTFMSNHSQLGSLFHLPGNYSSTAAVTGMQSKEQIANMVQGQISTAGAGGAAALASNLQSAQSQLDGYKDKLSSLGVGNGTAQAPDFKPNNEKTKSLWGRLQYGFNFQTTPSSFYYPTLVSLGLSLGYKLNQSNVIGIGMAYSMGTGNGIQHIALTSNGISLRSFVNIKIKGSFSATAGFEYNYTTSFTSYQQIRQLQDWTKSGLAGVTKTISTKSKLFKQTTLSLLWDVLSYQQIPQTQPIIFRIGYAF